MKKQFLTGFAMLSLAFGSLLIISCDEEGSVVNVPYTVTQVLKVDPISETGPQNLDTIVLEGNLEKALSDAGAEVGDIQEVSLKKIFFQAVTDSTGINNSNETFDAISAVDAYISGPSLSEINVATKATIPAGSTAFDLDVNTSANLAPYITLPQFTLRANGTLASPITTARYVKVLIEVNIKAEVTL